jgi:hypothetical protein
MAKLNITGNVTPSQWYKAITFDNGKPDAVAVALLSEIVYWYRPREVRDEATGAFVRYEKRFKADKLQRSYESFSQQFGFTKRQVTDALHRLAKLGVIDLDFRTITTDKGQVLGNVLFIGLNPDALEAITFQRDPSHVTTGPLSRSNGTPLTLERETNTENTTETTTQNTPHHGADAPIMMGSDSGNVGVEKPRRDLERSTAFSSPLDLMLQAILKAEAAASNRRGPKSFETMAQKQAYRQAAETIIALGGEDELHNAIQWALEHGRKSRARLIATLSTWAENLKNPQAFRGSGGSQRRDTIRVMDHAHYAVWAQTNAQPVPEPAPEAAYEDAPF